MRKACVSGECIIGCRIKIQMHQEREQVNLPFKIKGWCASVLEREGGKGNKHPKRLSHDLAHPPLLVSLRRRRSWAHG